MRLTKHGFEILRHYFRSYATAVPDDEIILPVHLVFLDEITLPFYLDEHRIVVFDAELGVKLRLLDGRLSKLVSIETDNI